MKSSDVVRIAAGAASLLASGVWLGGLLVLGAVVAPTIFREVPMPDSADAMTIVFTSFDRIAISAASIVAVAEVVRFRAERASRGNAIERIDLARLAVIAVAAVLAIIQGAWLSPAIIALHREGAIRGLGPSGERLERIHAWSERCGKTESLLLVALIVLTTHALARPSRQAH
jgi:putative copper export protein